MFWNFIKNILPKNGLVENVVVDGARFFWILEFSLENFIMFVKDPAFVGNKHEVIILMFILSGLMNQVTERWIYRWISHRYFGVVMESVVLQLEIVFIQHAVDIVLICFLWGLNLVLDKRLVELELLGLASSCFMDEFFLLARISFFLAVFAFFVLVVEHGNQTEDFENFVPHFVVFQGQSCFGRFNICKLKN